MSPEENRRTARLLQLMNSRRLSPADVAAKLHRKIHTVYNWRSLKAPRCIPENELQLLDLLTRDREVR